MEILAFNPSHDGGAAVVRDSHLICSIEAEKDSFVRHEHLTPHAVITSLAYASPDLSVIATAGGIKHVFSHPALPYASGYGGVGQSDVISEERQFIGRPMRFHSCPHERAHVMCSYGMSPFEHGEPCFALVWEGLIGRFYRIGPRLEITPYETVVCMPGAKYEFIYVIADNTDVDTFRPDLAGKVMALAACAPQSALATAEDRALINTLLEITDWNEFQKSRFCSSHIYRIGVDSARFHSFAKLFSDALFSRFLEFARQNLHPGYPLIIGGGCGLNCEWNSRLRDCGLFRDVFVPPCPNDSGIAIGAAVDAQYHLTNNAKVTWSPYAGEDFVMDVKLDRVRTVALNLDRVADDLARGAVIAWVQGRCEIGPRALGNRSLLASPLIASSRQRLNRIKRREEYRPVAPVCLERDASRYFSPARASPHMLYLHTVGSDDLPAVTHVDGSARIQTVNERENPRMVALLTAFKERTGCVVLCNTSLNFKARGFINRLSDLLRYCAETGVDGFVVGDVYGTTS